MRTNVLIQAAETVDRVVMRVEALEHWQQLKVYSMLLARYLGKRKIDLLRREIKSSSGIKLKTTPQWLINESRLRERLEFHNNPGSAIIITVASASKASYLYTKSLRFEGGLKVINKF